MKDIICLILVLLVFLSGIISIFLIIGKKEKVGNFFLKLYFCLTGFTILYCSACLIFC